MYETIYDTLSAANLLSSTATVVAAYNDEINSYPLVVVNPVDKGRDNPTYDRTYWTNGLTVNIDIFAKKNKEVDQLADEIDTLISPLKILGVQLSGLTESRGYPTTNDNKLHLKTMIFTYMR